MLTKMFVSKQQSNYSAVVCKRLFIVKSSSLFACDKRER